MALGRMIADISSNVTLVAEKGMIFLTVVDAVCFTIVTA